MNYDDFDRHIAALPSMRCEACGRIDNDYAPRRGLCCECYCRALYLVKADGNKVEDRIRAFNAAMDDAKRRESLFRALHKRNKEVARRKTEESEHKADMSRRWKKLARCGKVLDYLRRHSKSTHTWESIRDGIGENCDRLTIRCDVVALASEGKLRFSREWSGGASPAQIKVEVMDG